MDFGASQENEQPTVMPNRFGTFTSRLLVVVLFFLITVGMTWPLILNLRVAVPGPPWDNEVWLYDLWWFRHSIVDLGEWPTHNPTIFHPSGYDLRLSETMLPNKLLVAPFLFWADEVLAFNALILLSFVLTAYTTYLLVIYLTGNPLAATVAAAIFAFSPFRINAMAAGWQPLLATQWIPLVFLYLERLLRERKTRFALAAGLFMALTILSSWYYLYIVGSMLLIYLAARLWPWRQTLRRQHLGRDLLIFGALTLLLVLPVALPMLLNRSAQMGWSLAEVEKWAASLEDFFLPNIYHPLWGERFLAPKAGTLRYPWYAPGFVYLGLIALLLAWVGLFRTRVIRGEVRALGWVATVSFLLALGAVLHRNNQVVSVAAPAKMVTLFERGMSTLMSKLALNKASYYEIANTPGRIPIPLPALLLYLFLPLGNAMRTLYRFGLMTTFSVAVLAGSGAARLLGGSSLPTSVDREANAQRGALPRLSAGRVLLCALLLGLVLFDFLPAPLPFGFSEIRPQPLDLWLAARPSDAVIMQFPLVRALSGDSLYRTKYHGKNVAYGQGTFYPDSFRYAMPVLGTFPSEDSLSILSSWGVTHVVVGSGSYDAGWGDVEGQTWRSVEQQIQATGRLELIGVVLDEPFWRDERVSQIIRRSPPVEPILVDKVYVYELR